MRRTELSRRPHCVYLCEVRADDGRCRFKLGMTNRLPRRMSSLAASGGNILRTPVAVRLWSILMCDDATEAFAVEQALLVRYRDIVISDGTQSTEWLWPDRPRIDILLLDMHILREEREDRLFDRGDIYVTLDRGAEEQVAGLVALSIGEWLRPHQAHLRRLIREATGSGRLGPP